MPHPALPNTKPSKMLGITGFRLRNGPTRTAQTNPIPLPPALFDAGAQNRLMTRIKDLGQAFFAMSESQYGDWLDALSQDEFFELIALE